MEPGSFSVPALSFNHYSAHQTVSPVSDALQQVVCALSEVKPCVCASLPDLGVSVQALSSSTVLQHSSTDTLKLLQRQNSCERTPDTNLSRAAIKSHSESAHYASIRPFKARCHDKKMRLIEIYISFSCAMLVYCYVVARMLLYGCSECFNALLCGF